MTFGSWGISQNPQKYGNFDMWCQDRCGSSKTRRKSINLVLLGLFKALWEKFIKKFPAQKMLVQQSSIFFWFTSIWSYTSWLKEDEGKKKFSHLVKNLGNLALKRSRQKWFVNKKAILGIILIKLGIFKLVGKDCGNFAIGFGNSSILDLVTLALAFFQWDIRCVFINRSLEGPKTWSKIVHQSLRWKILLRLQLNFRSD